MIDYKYHLDKTSKKFNCPQCDKKRFVKYIEKQTGNYAESQYGRFDRETNCRYHAYPKNDYIENYNYVTPSTPVKPSYIDKEYLQKTLTKYEINPLMTYLYSHYSEGEVRTTFDKYQVGTSKMYSGATIFWQVDTTGKIRSGKIMAYDTSTGNRIKNDRYSSITWVHSILKKEDYNLKQCLFGLHLLNQTTNKIGIVESEKTALIMSIEFPQFTWMSTGSINGFKHEFLAPLIKRDITAFPDKGGYEKWKKTADMLNDKGFEITISKLLENKENENGWDLVDMLNYENK